MDVGVNDVGVGFCVGVVVVGVVSWVMLMSRDMGKILGGIGLGGVCSECYDSILFDEVDLICFLLVLIFVKIVMCMGVLDWVIYIGIVMEEFKGFGVDFVREVFEGIFVDVFGFVR